MGNKLGRRRHAVEEKYTRPQGLYQHLELDHKKLRKLILDSKLAPCYPGDEECTLGLEEECPICFLYYPSLNRSRCCMKGICTECFLQMKQTHPISPTQCPFCKTSNYAVEYRGMRTKEEKGLEEIEEQKVIEAKIRMQQQERQDEEERIQKRQSLCSSSRITTPGGVECREMSSSSVSVPYFTYAGQGDEFVSSQVTCSLPVNWPLNSRQNRNEDFTPNPEDITVMEAIWRSVQENATHRTPACSGNIPSNPSFPGYFYAFHSVPYIEASSGGRACEAASLAEQQHHVSGDIANVADINGTELVMLPQPSVLPMGVSLVEDYPSESWIEVSPSSGRGVHGGEGVWNADHTSEITEAGTSYISSNVAVDAMAVLPPPYGVSMLAGCLLPESVEEQMMRAMAVSLAEARARSNMQGWYGCSY